MLGEEGTEDLLNELYRLPTKHDFPTKKTVEGYMLQNYYRLQIAQMLENKQVDAALELAQKVKEDIDKIENSDHASEDMFLYVSLAHVYLYAHQYQAALEWIDKLLYHPQKGLHSNTRIQAMLLSLILHYELENDDLVVSLVRSYRRKLKAQKAELTVEFNCFSIFLKLLKAEDKTIQQSHFKALKSNLMTLQTSDEKAKFYSYKHIIWWVEGRSSITRLT